MKAAVALMTLSALLQAWKGEGAESVTNLVRWQPASNSIAAARWAMKGNSPFAISTNTDAFEAYGLDFMLAAANDMRIKWQLDIPQPLTLNDVDFRVQATAHGVKGHLQSRDKRFVWEFDRNALFSFQDLNHHPPSFRYKDDESARLATMRSKITAREAEVLAREALHKLFAMTEKQLRMKNAVEVNQYKFEESDGKVYPLPMFDVRWRMAGPKQHSADNLEYTPLYMSISGITKTVAGYEHAEYLNLDSPLPRLPIPTNYFQMLGLPDNYLDTVSDRKRALWGLPPLTNPPARASHSAK